MKNNQKGFSHILLVLLAVIVIGGVGFAAFRIGSKSSDKKMTDAERSQQQKDAQGPQGAVLEKGASGCTPDAPVTEAKDAFTHLPFKLSQLKLITNGKDTNDSRFVYPWVNTDAGDRTEIFAPATGKLYLIRHKVFEIDGKKSDDFDMFFAVDCKTVYRFNHITNPRDDIKATYPGGELPSGDYANGGLDIPERVKPKTLITVKAGEPLGYTKGTPIAHNFDFAIGVSTSREGDKLAICPLTVFKDPFKTQMADLFGPKATGKPQAGFKCDVESKKF